MKVEHKRIFNKQLILLKILPKNCVWIISKYLCSKSYYEKLTREKLFGSIRRKLTMFNHNNNPYFSNYQVELSFNNKCSSSSHTLFNMLHGIQKTALMYMLRNVITALIFYTKKLIIYVNRIINGWISMLRFYNTWMID